MSKHKLAWLPRVSWQTSRNEAIYMTQRYHSFSIGILLMMNTSQNSQIDQLLSRKIILVMIKNTSKVEMCHWVVIWSSLDILESHTMSHNIFLIQKFVIVFCNTQIYNNDFLWLFYVFYKHYSQKRYKKHHILIFYVLYWYKREIKFTYFDINFTIRLFSTKLNPLINGQA